MVPDYYDLGVGLPIQRFNLIDLRNAGVVRRAATRQGLLCHQRDQFVPALTRDAIVGRCRHFEVGIDPLQRLDQAPEGFTLRLQAFELAPHLVSIEQLSEIAEKYGQWRPLCELHVARVREAQQQGAELPIDSVLAASAIYEQRLGDPEAAFKLLRRAMPLSVTGAIAATTPGQGAERILGEMNRLVRALGKSARRGEDSAERELDAVTVVRDGETTWPPPPVQVSAAPAAKASVPPPPTTGASVKVPSPRLVSTWVGTSPMKPGRRRSVFPSRLRSSAAKW